MLKGKLTPTRFLQGTISKVPEVIGSNIQPLTIRNNGTYEVSGDVDGFNPVYVDTPEPKEEQEKIVDIIENGTVEVLPDENKALSKVTINSNVPDTSGIIEDIIDNSGVLEDTEGTVTEKVEGLIGKANSLNAFACVTTTRGLFRYARHFPSKAEINLLYATDLCFLCANWDTEPIPIVEELTVNAPNMNVNNHQPCMGSTFMKNKGVKKVILNMPDGCKYMECTFQDALNVEEIVLNFSTNNITSLYSAFSNCRKLKKIVGVFDFSSTTSLGYTFDRCSNLEEITFEPNTLSLSISLAESSKLTSESIQSVIDGLATVETARALTLNKAIALTDEQKATINAKGWTLAQ